jgi:AraC-like DNA-binding protein
MPVLPIPMIIAVALFAFLLQRLLTRDTHQTLLALIGICATQSAIIALVNYYDVVAIKPLQPVLATLIAPIAWIAFLQAAGGANTLHLRWLHALGFVLAIIFLFVQPALLDILIPASFFAYGVAMLLRLSRGEDSLPHTPLENGAIPVLAWRVVALSLIASAACDVFIAYSLANGAKGALFWIPSVVSSLSLLSLGALSLSHAMESRRDDSASSSHSSVSSEDTERDLKIIATLDGYVKANKPYLDPDLTLSRLSRKLSIPAKQLSTAINRIKAENLSRYINRLRIEHACLKLEHGESVTTAMLDSGFNTKSNFNREFLRITGQAPRDWKVKNASAGN